MSELEKENEQLIKSGRLKETRARITAKASHKQVVPLTAKKWSISQKDYVLLRFGFFWELIEKKNRK
jgi:hypothetical protein